MNCTSCDGIINTPDARLWSALRQGRCSFCAAAAGFMPGEVHESTSDQQLAELRDALESFERSRSSYPTDTPPAWHIEALDRRVANLRLKTKVVSDSRRRRRLARRLLTAKEQLRATNERISLLGRHIADIDIQK